MTKVPTLVVLLTLLLGSGMVYGTEAAFRAEGGDLLVQTPAWTLALDAAKGAVRRLEDRRATGTLLRGGPELWVIQRHKAPISLPRLRPETRLGCERPGRSRLEFDGPDAAVQIVCLRCRRRAGLAVRGADETRHDDRLAFSDRGVRRGRPGEVRLSREPRAGVLPVVLRAGWSG